MKISICFLIFLIILLTKCTDTSTNTNQNINPNISYSSTILQADSSLGNLLIIVTKDYTAIFWNTLFEINNSGWEIQKGDSNQVYIPIGFMSGSGTASEIHEYSFKDYGDISKIFFYRFKQINFDGSSNIFVEAKITIH